MIQGTQRLARPKLCLQEHDINDGMSYKYKPLLYQVIRLLKHLTVEIQEAKKSASVCLNGF